MEMVVLLHKHCRAVLRWAPVVARLDGEMDGGGMGRIGAFLFLDPGDPHSSREKA